jgi:hypothetical protein
MKKCLSILLPLFIFLISRSQSFVASEIPDSLIKNANSVVRLDELVVEIKSPGHVITKERHVYTILNENADHLATYKTNYDKFTSINSVQATLYDAQGKELKRFKKKDMQDLASESEMTLASDDRYKVGSFYCRDYPYTVDFEEEDEIVGILALREWDPPRSSKKSVQESRYSITAQKDYKVRYELINSDIHPDISEKNGKVTYTWEIRNLPTIPEEPFAVSATTYDPYMLVGPSEFEAEGYKGDMSTWTAYGKFYASLQKGRDVLPDETKRKVHELTNGIPDIQEKVAVLYKYLQKNTHYVSIQFGIGGLQPFDATYVAKNKFGDCKALSNFMVALLEEAGIKANPVIIHCGKDNTEFVKDFACDQFDHVICCIPLKKDTIWLECTDPYLPPGYLSDFTANRYGLLIGDDGGTLVHTPAYLLPDNTQVRNIDATLDSDGNLVVRSKSAYKSACQDDINLFIHYQSKDEQLRSLKTQFDLPTYDVNSFEYQEDYSNRLPVLLESLQITVTDYAQISGRRIFINPNILTRSSVKLPEDKDRALDIEFKDEFRHVDSVQIAIPGGYETESQLHDVILQTKYGKYETHAVIGPNKIIYYRIFEQYSGRFPCKEYGDVVKFYNKIYDADHTKIVLVKKS